MKSRTLYTGFFILSLVSVLFLFPGDSGAQDFKREVLSALVNVIGGGTEPIPTQSASVSPSNGASGLKEQLIREMVKALRPEDIQEIARALAKELAADPQIREFVMRSLTSGLGANSALGAAPTRSTPAPEGRMPLALAARLAKMGITPASVSANSVVGTVNNRSETSSLLRGNLVAIITHPSNKVNTLTMDQVKGIFCGEITNWNQVGGEDQPIKVITWRGAGSAIEAVLGKSICKTASKTAFVSLMIPSVNQTRGAAGFIPTANMEQLEFIIGHDAVKKIALKTDENAPAIPPAPRTLADGSYPIATRPVSMTSLDTSMIPQRVRY